VVTRPWEVTLNIGVLTAALAAIFFALTTIFTKRLTRTTPVANILFWLTVMQAGFGLVAAGYAGSIPAPSWATLPWLTLVGIAGLLAHFCITNALSIAPASVVIPIDFVRLPTISVIGMIMYSEPLSLAILAGAVLIFLGNYINILSETRRNPHI
jgi:drug/metabolite transporter (DMT)-like permease